MSNTTSLPTEEPNISIKVYQKRLHELNERVKELNCLYEISKLVERSDANLDDIMQGVADQISESWQYPDITCSRIVFEYREFRSPRYRETQWCQASDIFVNGEKNGAIEVYYLERRPDSDEGPFMKEERNLLNVIAERLGNIVALKQAEHKMHEMQGKLEAKAIHLEESNAALKYLIEHQKSERLKMEGEILQRLNVLVFPYLEKLKLTTRDESQGVYVQVIERNLCEITRHFNPGVEAVIAKLAPVEQQIVNLLKDNKSTKDIARLLNMSENTVFFYRKSIRKKLSLNGKRINLKSYLQSLQ